MKPMLFAMPFFLLTILLEAWIARRKGKKIYDIPDAITSLQLGILNQVSGLFLLKLLWVGIYVAAYEKFRATALPIDSAWVWIGALIAYDFCAYWAHRMDLEVNILWATHVVHHTSEYYNLSTALRQSSTGAFLHWIFYLPLAVAGVPPVVFFTVSLVDLLYQYWVHTELIGRLGWMERVFVTPSNHRVHHGQNAYCIDKNYGGVLIVWDRLFGTFAEERRDGKIIYGIRKPLRSYNPLWGNLHTFADLWAESMAARGWRAKIGVWMAPPGGWTDKPVAEFDSAAFTRYTEHTPTALRRYVASQYAILFAAVMHLVAVAATLTLLDKSLYALAVLATVQSLGALLAGGVFGRRVEQVRVIVLGIAFALAPDWFGYAAPIVVKGSVLVILLGSAAWLQAACRRKVSDFPA